MVIFEQVFRKKSRHRWKKYSVFLHIFNIVKFLSDEGHVWSRHFVFCSYCRQMDQSFVCLSFMAICITKEANTSSFSFRYQSFIEKQRSYSFSFPPTNWSMYYSGNFIKYNPWKPPALIATASAVAGLTLVGMVLGLGLGIGLNNDNQNLTSITTTTTTTGYYKSTSNDRFSKHFLFYFSTNSKQFVDQFNVLKYFDKQQFNIQSTSSTNSWSLLRCNSIDDCDIWKLYNPK